MNINKLEVGQTYKNYKVLCEALGESVKTGKSKILQVENWERFFSYEKSGYSFQIVEIFETPIEKIDLRAGGNSRVKYIEKIEKLILDLLAQESSRGQIFLSKNKLLAALKMVNQNYTYGKTKPFKLSKITKINPKEIFEFFETSDGMLKRNLESALDNLKDQSLITWKSAMTVCFLETEATDITSIKSIKSEFKDEYGDDAVKFGVNHPNQKLIHRKATPEEEALIIEVRRDILDKYECEKVSDIFKTGKEEAFFREVRDIVFDKANIYFYYNSYEIIFNQHHILKEWKLKEREELQEELNSDIKEKISENTRNRHLKASSKYNETQKEKYKMRLTTSYLSNSYTLTHMLIDMNTEAEYI